MMQFVMVRCPCCKDNLVCPCGIVQTGKITTSVGFSIQMPWPTCPTCSYDMSKLRFRSPELQARQQAPPERMVKL